jgi:hypothetical protein
MSKRQCACNCLCSCLAFHKRYKQARAGYDCSKPLDWLETMSVRRSLAWTYIAQIICFAISFGSTVIIARLVSPRDFGIFAMAGAATTIINLLMQSVLPSTSCVQVKLIEIFLGPYPR